MLYPLDLKLVYNGDILHQTKNKQKLLLNVLIYIVYLPKMTLSTGMSIVNDDLAANSSFQVFPNTL